jgi:hypothetical protein
MSFEDFDFACFNFKKLCFFVFLCFSLFFTGFLPCLLGFAGGERWMVDGTGGGLMD